MATRCPSDEYVAAFVEGDLTASEASALRSHLGECEACAEIVADYARAFGLASAQMGSTQAPSASRGTVDRSLDLELTEGDMFDRYVVLMLAGRGGMGEVYVVYDPDLDRKIALKIVRPACAPDDAAQQRLLAEARTAAAITHDNLVQIYDVGVSRGRAYIAMEYVDGPPLSRWLRATTRTRPEIVSMFLGAARGLCAAHEAGIVHRDFKPSNVLVGREGRPRVADFGLAQLTDVDAASGIVGTPAYMAPEQWRTNEVDPRADQYAFCVALYEALHGERPGPAEAQTGHATSEPVSSHHQAPNPPRARGRLEAIVQRGLCEQPDDRFDSMSSLIRALERVSARRSWRWRVPTTVVLAATAALGLGLGVTPPPPTAPTATTCDGQRRVREAWNPRRHAAVRASLTRTGVTFAVATIDSTVRILDRYTVQWATAFDQACTESPSTAEPSACLQRAKAELTSTVGLLEHANAEVAARAVALARGLPDPHRCLQLHAGGFPTADGRSRVEAVDRQIAEGYALRRAGRYEAAGRVTVTAMREGEALAHTPLLARAAFASGTLAIRNSEFERAATELARAAWFASQASDDRIHVEALAALVGLEGARRGRPKQAARWAVRARQALATAGSPPRLQQSLLLSEGAVAAMAGDDALAIEVLERATELAAQIYGETDRRVARPLQAIGIARLRAGDIKGAKRDLARALAISEEALGAHHPSIPHILDVLTAVASHEKDYDSALGFSLRSLRIAEQAYGHDALTTAIAHQHTGMMLDDLGRGEEATVHLHKAIAGMEAVGGEYDKHLISALDSLGIRQYRDRNYAAANATLSRSLAIAEHLELMQHGDTANVWSHLGDVLRQQGKLSEARSAHTQALEIRRVRGRPHRVAASLDALARVAKAEEDWPLARALYQDAANHWEAGLGADHPNAVGSRESLAEIEHR